MRWRYDREVTREFLSLDDTIGKYEIALHPKESQDALYELMIKVNWATNNPENESSSNFITSIPMEVQQRSKHFSDQSRKKMMLTAWIESYDGSDFNLLIEKFYETSPYGCNDDVWRVTAHEWSVVFVATRSFFAGSTRDKAFIHLPYEAIANGTSKHGFQILLNSYFTAATLFAITGNRDSFIADAMQWKLSR